LIEPEIGLFLVSDGMGGHRGGALAADIVAQDLPIMIETRLMNLKSATPQTVRTVFKKTILEQNRQLLLEGTSESGHRDMGATVAVVMLKDGRAYVVNLGDSRVYLFRNGRLRQLTKDHSVVSELVTAGKIKPEQVEDHQASGELTHYIGMEEEADPHLRSLTLKTNDRLLLCTDGLTSMVSDADIAAIVKDHPRPQLTCEQLVHAANAAGGHDNITAVVVDWLSRARRGLLPDQ